MFEKNFSLEEKKETSNFQTTTNTTLKNNNNNAENNSSKKMQIENPNFFFTSASPKKKEPKNIQLRKQENVNTFTKSNSISTNSLKIKNSKALNQKLLNIEQRLKAYLKESHRFFKTKSIDHFLENSESLKGFNQQGQIISEPDFDKLCNFTLTPNKSFRAFGGDSGCKAFNNSLAKNNQNLLSANNNNNINNNNSILSSNVNANNLNNNNNNKKANNNLNNNNINNNFNASGFFKMQQNSNVSSINYSTNYHKAHNTTTPFNNSNGTIPSIFKNFFEEKEVKELNKKRHSVAVGDLLHKNALLLKNSNFSECEFKQKYQSNHTANNSNNLAKLNFFLGENQTGSASGSGNSQSRISDFSVDLNFNNLNNLNNCNSDSNEDSLIQGLQEGESSVRTGSFKILKRNSILRERRVSCRTNGYMNSFDVVVEEEKNAFGTNTSEENSEEESDEKKFGDA